MIQCVLLTHRQLLPNFLSFGVFGIIQPGSAVYDPKIDAIRVRCAENTTVLVKEIKPASGQPAEAKSITNGFFVKEEGVFRGNFLPPDFQ
jgi:methionyl-tRNA formyltransferase